MAAWAPASHDDFFAHVASLITTVPHNTAQQSPPRETLPADRERELYLRALCMSQVQQQQQESQGDSFYSSLPNSSPSTSSLRQMSSFPPSSTSGSATYDASPFRDHTLDLRSAPTTTALNNHNRSNTNTTNAFLNDLNYKGSRNPFPEGTSFTESQPDNNETDNARLFRSLLEQTANAFRPSSNTEMAVTQTYLPALFGGAHPNNNDMTQQQQHYHEIERQDVFSLSEPSFSNLSDSQSTENLSVSMDFERTSENSVLSALQNQMQSQQHQGSHHNFTKEQQNNLAALLAQLLPPQQQQYSPTSLSSSMHNRLSSFASQESVEVDHVSATQPRDSLDSETFSPFAVDTPISDSPQQVPYSAHHEFTTGPIESKHHQAVVLAKSTMSTLRLLPELPKHTPPSSAISSSCAQERHDSLDQAISTVYAQLNQKQQELAVLELQTVSRLNRIYEKKRGQEESPFSFPYSSYSAAQFFHAYESSSLYSSLFFNSDCPRNIITPTMRFLDCNQSYADECGVPREAFKPGALACFDVVQPVGQQSKASAIDAFARCIRGELVTVRNLHLIRNRKHVLVDSYMWAVFEEKQGQKVPICINRIEFYCKTIDPLTASNLPESSLDS